MSIDLQDLRRGDGPRRGPQGDGPEGEVEGPRVEGEGGASTSTRAEDLGDGARRAGRLRAGDAS